MKTERLDIGPRLAVDGDPFGGESLFGREQVHELSADEALDFAAYQGDLDFDADLQIKS